MRNKARLFLIPVAIFIFSLFVVGSARADQCIRGDCKANCGSDEEQSTSPGDMCTDSYNICCVPKACPSSSLLGCIPSSTCSKPTPGGSCSTSGQTCCDVKKSSTGSSCADLVNGATCTTSDGKIGTCKSGLCSTGTTATSCADLVNGAACTTSDGKIGTCKSGLCSTGTTATSCADLVNGAACTTTDGKTGTCSGGTCKSGSGSGSGTPGGSGSGSGSDSGWNSAGLGDFGLPGTALKDIIMGVLDWLLTIIGILAIIALVISGIQYYLVATDEKMLETAKKTMQAAIIGLIVALSGFIVIRAVDAMLNVRTLF